MQTPDTIEGRLLERILQALKRADVLRPEDHGSHSIHNQTYSALYDVLILDPGPIKKLTIIHPLR
jgi:hypothetical protein